MGTKTNILFGCADEFTDDGVFESEIIEFFIEDLYYAHPCRAYKYK